MSLFWQITLIEFLLNVAVFAGAVILYGPMRVLAVRLAGRREVAEKAAAGLLFGTATSVALLLPVHLNGGSLVSCGTILLALAGPLDGTVAIVIGLASSVLIEQLPWVTTGHSRQLTTLSLFVAATLGFIFEYALAHRRFPAQKRLLNRDLPALGALAAAGSLCVLWRSAGAPAVISSSIPAMVSNILAAVILGTLLLHDKHRSETERELRESEATLARQAKELAVARDSADGANRAKSMFLANMSHELRTPLNAILGYAQMLKQDRNVTKLQAEAYNTIQQSGEHLLTLIVDILDISRIEAGKLELQLVPVNMSGFLDGIANIIRIKAEEKGIDFRCVIPSDVPSFLQADQKHLRQVLLNLLSNAVKFTDKGRVELRVQLLSQSHEDVRLRFEVRDTGTGIARDQLEKIFQPFEQVCDERHRAGGTGLGLSISRQLIRLMGSEIRVESTQGQGSCFSFEMALLTVGPEPAEPSVSGRITGYEGPRVRVQVIDDVAANRSMLADTLGHLGFEVSHAVNGLEAVTLAQAIPPALILMDIRMPEMGGIEAIRSMQQIPELRMIPVIAVSAGVTEEDQINCIAAGAKAILNKPIEIAILLKEIGELLNLKWVRERTQQAISPSDERAEQFVVPEPAQMEFLHELARAGNMRAIQEEAGRLAELNPQYRPFVDRITQLAKGYQSRAVLRLVEKHAAQEQVANR